MLVLESERLTRKQLCASACSLRKFGEAVNNSLLLTKIVRIRCKTLIVFNAPRLKTAVRQKTRSLIASRLSTENRHFRLYLTPVVRPKKYICTLKILTGKNQAT